LQAAWAAGALSCVCATACVPGGGWQGVPQIAPEKLAASGTLSPAHIDAAAWPTEQWWAAYQDLQLNSLMQEALAGSPSLQSAQARLQAAQARALQASGARLPATTLAAELRRQRYSQNGLYPPPFAGHVFTDGELALNFSYDIDFWGRNRDILQAARADVRAAEADRAAARLALTVALARAYFQLDLQFALLDVAQASLEQQNTILTLTRQRASSGLENAARVSQSEASAALTQAGVQYTQSQIKMLRAQLGDLVGAGPDRGATLDRPHLQGPQQLALPSALPAELLGRRPDVTAQRWRVEGAARGIAAAEADFYPNVNLAAFAGFQSIGLSKLLDAASAVAGAGPALSLPIFNRRQLRGALASRQAQYDQSVAQYNQTLIDAVNEVADVVTNWEALMKESDAARVAEEAAQRAYGTTRERYRAGLDNYLSVLSAQNELFLTQTVRAQLLARGLSLTADLVEALGGGYLGQAPTQTLIGN
jgi:NodT family efflux transporter outer membrane factor (OMF) lipoprotein